MALSAPKLPSMKGFSFAKLAKYADPQAIKDLDSFLDNLPIRAGMNGIIVAGIIWAIAGASLLMAYTKSVNIRELYKELTTAEAIMPNVPQLTYLSVSAEQTKPQIDRLKQVYKNLTIEPASGGVRIAANSTREFGAWRAAIGDLAYGGNSWRVQVKELCAGRDCVGAPLQAILSVQQLDIKIPDIQPKS